MRIMLIAALLLTSACGHRMPNHLPYVTTDGRYGWSTQCNNWDQTIANCVESARIVCEGDFREIARHEGMAMGTNAWTGGASEYPTRRLEYICVDPAKNPQRSS